FKVEDYVHNVGYSQRSHVPVEPYLSEQWFLKYPSVEPSTKAVEEGKITFHPERWSKTYSHWMHNIKDWCISRQLWWGHRVPAWRKVEKVHRTFPEPLPSIGPQEGSFSGVLGEVSYVSQSVVDEDDKHITLENRVVTASEIEARK